MTPVDAHEAHKVLRRLSRMPVAPAELAPLVNVGTNPMLDALERHYFTDALAQGISCFKYVQGYYGSGKSQFIHSLAARARQHGVATGIVQIGTECPFNSPLAIFQHVMQSLSFPNPASHEVGLRGVDTILDAWARRQLHGIESSAARQHHVAAIEQALRRPLSRVRDLQAGRAIRQLATARLKRVAGSPPMVGEDELLAWVRGERIRSRDLAILGLTKPADEQNAINRLKTILLFLREHLGIRGFLIAFDEGGRTVSLRAGSSKQRQAIENMLGMINDQAEGDYQGAMFVYTATPEFRSRVISDYEALAERIGSEVFACGRPMVPFIDLDDLDTPGIVRQIGERLLTLAEAAWSVQWDWPRQRANIEAFLDAEQARYGVGSEIRRDFVFHFLAFLETQRRTQRAITAEEAEAFLQANPSPEDATA